MYLHDGCFLLKDCFIIIYYYYMQKVYESTVCVQIHVKHFFLRVTLSRVCMGPGKLGILFSTGIFQDWKVLEKDHWAWKVQEIC